MTASMNMSVQMMPDLIRPNRKAKNDANTRMTLNDYGSFVHPGNVTGVTSPNSNVFIPQNALMLPPPPPQMPHHVPQEGLGRPEEEVLEPGRRRRRATDEDEHSRAPLGKKPKRISGSKVGDNDCYDENSLYGAIKSGRVAPQALVDDWIEQYKSNRDAAMLELMQFFISCSGCRGKITPEMYSRMSHADIIRRMTEEFDEDSGEYPLIQTGPVWRRFRSYFVDFIAILIRHCQYSIIYDQYMMEQIIALLTGLTDSQVRAFRHTSTLASMKMMTALVDVALTVSINLDNTQRQYEAERSKSKSGRAATDRLDVLMRKRKELEENMNEVKNMMTYLFKGVFVHRYRDSQPEIRSICMNEIGFWMRKYPNMFLDDSYLKYVGWTLYDRVGEVRLQCLRSLQPLYEDPQLIGRLELFTNRFKVRLVDMTLDKETEVGVQAVRLICTILKYNENILEDKDCENIYELVYSSHRPLSQAAGEFLNRKLFQVDSHAPIMKSKKGKKRSVNTPLIRDLVQFFIESELHEHAAYLVDSLWDTNPMLRDWECMLDLLLEEPGRGEEPLDDRQESSLIEILTCCIKQAATGESPIGRQPAGAAGRKQLTARELRTLEADRSQLTSVLMSALPSLLMKYNLDGEKMLSLLQIPLHMDLEMYITNRQEKHLDMLLKYLQETVEKHNDMEVLIACSKAYEALCADDLGISTKCQTVKSTLLDQLSETYKQAFLDYYNEQGDEPDEDDEFILLSALKKIYAFSCCHDMASRDLWNSFITVSRSALERPHYNEEIVSKGISCATQTLMWRLRELDEYNSQDKNEVKNLKKMLNLFLSICCQYLKCQSKKIARESFVSICDLLIIFSRNIASHLEVMQPLIYEPDKELENGLMFFLSEHVFVEDMSDDDENAKIEELHNRRTYLACYSKLIVYNVLPVRCASLLFKHFLRFYNDYGDIMKLTLTKTKEINKVQASRAILTALQSVYLELIAEGETWDTLKSSDKFYGLKELVRRLSLSFGLDLVKIRDMIFTIHVDALLFSIQTPQQNLPFIELMTEFSNKVSKSDKRILADYVNKLITQQPIQLGEMLKNSPHMIAYRTSLDPELAEVASNMSSAISGSIAGHVTGAAGGTIGSGGGRGRVGGNKRARESVDVTNQSPQLTSTAAKKRRGTVQQSSALLHSSQTALQVEVPPGDESALTTPAVKYSSRGRPIR